MDSSSLLRICHRDSSVRRVFAGVFPSDRLPNKVALPCALIGNTKPSTHRGEHWLGIFINKEGYGDFFCSYGLPPSKAFVDFMNRNCVDWNFNRKEIQNTFATTCGQYALFFLHARAKGLPMRQFVTLFTKNKEENDEMVTAFINGLYNEDTKIVDVDMLIN